MLAHILTKLTTASLLTVLETLKQYINVNSKHFYWFIWRV